jgi:hypothetical protein
MNANGCKPPRESAFGENATELAISQEKANVGLARNGSPTEVAERVLQLAENQDQEGIFQLTARKQISADLQAITGGRPEFQKFTGSAEKKVAALIASSLNGFDPDSLRVSSEVVDGDRAIVKIQGTRQEQPIDQNLYMVREDGTWKLVPSHRQ